MSKRVRARKKAAMRKLPKLAARLGACEACIVMRLAPAPADNPMMVRITCAVCGREHVFDWEQDEAETRACQYIKRAAKFRPGFCAGGFTVVYQGQLVKAVGDCGSLKLIRDGQIVNERERLCGAEHQALEVIAAEDEMQTRRRAVALSLVR